MQAMWRNYLTVGFRALTKSKTYAFINIFGLAIGLAACLMILLYVRYETSYDKWLPDAERVYQVQSIHTDPETGEVSRQQGTHGVITETLRQGLPADRGDRPRRGHRAGLPAQRRGDASRR